MSMMNSMSRIRGQEKGPGYTQTEVILGEAMQKFGRELGEESNFGELQHIKSWSQKVWQTLFLQTLQEQSRTILFLQVRRKEISWKMYESVFQPRSTAECLFSRLNIKMFFKDKHLFWKSAVGSNERVTLKIPTFFCIIHWNQNACSHVMWWLNTKCVLFL